MAPKSKEISQEQQVNFLRKIDFFHDFDNHELRQLLAVTSWLKLSENSLIIKEGALERVFYILVKGSVAVFKTNAKSGERLTLNTLDTGSCFGEMSLVGDMPRTAGIVTTTECFLLKVEPEIIKTSNVFLQLKFFQRFCELLVNRLIEANQRMLAMEGAEITAKEEWPPEIATPPEESAEIIREPIPKVDRKPSVTLVKESALPEMPEPTGRRAVTRMQRSVAGVEALAINPEVAIRISPYLYGEEQNTRKFADIISLDPYLSFRILQLANSSFFRRATPVLTVPHAMIVIGIEPLLELLRDAEKATRELKPFGDFPKRLGGLYWRNSVVVGRIANLLRNVLGVNITPDIYMAGLLHRLGTLVIDRLEPAFYPQMLKEGNDFSEHLIESEIEYVGADHGNVGAWYGKKWGIPSPYLEVMCNYRTPQKAREQPMLCALVHLATQFALRRGVCFGDKIEPEKSVVDSFAWIIIQEHQTTFLEADIPSFVADFEAELTNTWSDIFGDLG